MANWVQGPICRHCGEASHIYFCLKDPAYLKDPEGFKRQEKECPSCGQEPMINLLGQLVCVNEGCETYIIRDAS